MRLTSRLPFVKADAQTFFPGEDDGDFKMTLHALEEIQYDGIFAFKYSKRPDTKALALPDHVDEKVKSKRLDEVLKLQESITYKKNKDLEGREIEVLVEGPSETDKSILTGRTGTNKIVNFPGDIELIGSLVRIKILHARHHSLVGEKV